MTTETSKESIFLRAGRVLVSVIRSATLDHIVNA